MLDAKVVLVLAVMLVLVGVYAVSLYKKYKEQGKDAALLDLRETAWMLFQKAEEKFGAKTGPDKMAWAVKQFYLTVAPEMVKQYLPENTVEEFLQKTFESGYEKLKDYLDDGEINDSTLTDEK